MVFILNSMADFFLAVLLFSVPSCVALVSFRFHWHREKTNSLFKNVYADSCSIILRWQRYFIKKGNFQNIKLFEKFFKKIYLLWVGPNEKCTGGKKLTTKWLTFTRAYLPRQGYFIKEGSFLSPKNLKCFFKFFFRKTASSVICFSKEQSGELMHAEWQKKYQDDVPKTILCLLTQKTEHHLSLYSTCIHKMEMFVLAT